MKTNPALNVGASYFGWSGRPTSQWEYVTKKTRKLCKTYYEMLNTALL